MKIPEVYRNFTYIDPLKKEDLLRIIDVISDHGPSEISDEIFAFQDRYQREHPEFGPLHLALSDGNLSDSDLSYCKGSADAIGDEAGSQLMSIYQAMTVTERVKMYLRHGV